MITPQKYLVFKMRVKTEIENLSLLEKRLNSHGLFPGINTDTFKGFPLNDEDSCRTLGTYLHDYYSVLEKIFSHVATDIDGSMPGGSDWHKKLLEQMTMEIPGIRLAFISQCTKNKVDKLRGFRHVFRNIYGFNLDPDKIQFALKDLPDVSINVRKDIDIFFNGMDTLLLARD